LDDAPDPEFVDMKRRFWISAILTIPVFVLAMAEMLPNFHAVLSPRISLWIQFVLATPVVLWGGFPFFVRGWQSIGNRSPNMFTLIAIGTSAAFLYSVAALVFPQIFPATMRGAHNDLIHVYFEAAAVITTLVLLGQVLELHARAQTSGALKEFLGLVPVNAHVVYADGEEAEIDLKDLQTGAILRVKANEKIPTDGVILEGAATVDESMITGEPVPVEKSVGETVIGGTINGNRTFTIRATRVGSETMLAQIVRMVGEAQCSRARSKISRRSFRLFRSGGRSNRSRCFRRLVLVRGLRVRARRGGFDFDYRLPVRARSGNADVNYGRHGSRRACRSFD
jgi:Cu+-exporting ATPase